MLKTLRSAQTNSSAGPKELRRGFKSDMTLPVLIANVVFYILKDSKDWPGDTVLAVLEDALKSRTLVDNELCRQFRENVFTFMAPIDYHDEESTSMWSSI